MATVDEHCILDIMDDGDHGLQRWPPETPTRPPRGTKKNPKTKSRRQSSITASTTCRSREVHFDSPISTHSSSYPASTTNSDMNNTARPTVLGLHHLKLAVTNLDVSLAWYERVLGGHRIPSLDHIHSDGTRFAAIISMPDWGPTSIYLELRLAPAKAKLDRGWDFVTLTARGRRELEEWARWLDHWGTVRSEVLIGRRGWVLGFEDPDGRRVRIFTREGHEGALEASQDGVWLGEGD